MPNCRRCGKELEVGTHASKVELCDRCALLAKEERRGTRGGAYTPEHLKGDNGKK